VTAISAFARGVVLEKLNRLFTFRAFHFEDRPRLPVLGVLSGTFHGCYPFNFRSQAVVRRT